MNNPEHMSMCLRADSVSERIKMLQQNATKKDRLMKGQSQLERLQKDDPK